MKVHTKNSVYEIEEHPKDPELIVIKKVNDKYEGGHPNIKEGDVFVTKKSNVKIDKSLSWFDEKRQKQWNTSKIISIDY